MTSIALQSKNFAETRSTTVLSIGPWQQSEFAVVRGQVADSDSWSTAEGCETASELLASNELIPDVILLAEPLPATYQQKEIEILRRVAPLAHLVVVAGTWCEGELRTGKPLQGVIRMYWHEFAPWWQARTEPSSSCLPALDGPLTARNSQTDKSLAVSIVIHTRTLASYEALAAALKYYGAKCEWGRDSQIPDTTEIGIWDGGQLDPEEWWRLETFASRVRQSGGSLVALLDFPRKEHIARLNSLGCNAVLGKPYVVAELVTALRHSRAGVNDGKAEDCNPWA